MRRSPPPSRVYNVFVHHWMSWKLGEKPRRKTMRKFGRMEQWREAGGVWKGKNSNHRKNRAGRDVNIFPLTWRKPVKKQIFSLIKFPVCLFFRKPNIYGRKEWKSPCDFLPETLQKATAQLPASLQSPREEATREKLTKMRPDSMKKKIIKALRF